ncbi:MAG: hypothetical protein EXR72_12380 [Myxococcales bacterium]|nr:hypothetical protein [Myxococcales bacterium]
MLALAGCASAGRGGFLADDLGSSGGADGAGDLAGVARDQKAPADLAGGTSEQDATAPDDLAGSPDQSLPPDLTVIPDLASIPDLAMPIDQSVPVDLAMADLAREDDLAVALDLAKPPDLKSPADLVKTPDLVKPPDLLKPPDLAVNCQGAAAACDTVAQNCCQNLKCGATVGKAQCVATGNVPAGGSCGKQGVDDCVPGTVCIFESALIPLSLCRYFCKVDADCKSGGKCVFTLQGGNLKVCSDPVNGCNPVPPQSGCNMGGCYVNTPNGQTGCHAIGTGGSCALCDSDYDCKAGFICVGNATLCLGAGCLKLCKPGVTNCGGLLSCYNVNGWPNTLGICDL